MQRSQIRTNLIRKMDMVNERMDLAELHGNVMELAKTPMNGRQIRNAINTARQLARYHDRQLELKDLKLAIRVNRRFDKYVAEVRNNVSDENYQLSTMSDRTQIQTICQDIKDNYSCCDVADALLKLKSPWAGFLPDIAPIPRRGESNGRIVAPISTMQFVPKDFTAPSSSDTHISKDSNIPKGTHWTDCPGTDTIVVMQQPTDQVCALLGDLMATRLKIRGVKAAVINGRVRDVATIGQMSDFQVWSKGISAVGTGLQAKPWAVDVPLQIGEVTVRAGDILVADEDDRGIVVIPQDKLEEAYKLLPGLKKADDGVLQELLDGSNVTEAFAKHR
ncbi:hypothetical protein AMS68_004310 [Peltaster fructicola]|uniref:AAA+ ATPase lid domain-containing protein n=1 Tax=Peltaster fructicola TaxID=286661 RepID=A0A6H0XVL7_9PEZI|nr:hypothetical protein AMS68_004310 [Peltaster fructicola]